MLPKISVVLFSLIVIPLVTAKPPQYLPCPGNSDVIKDFDAEKVRINSKYQFSYLVHVNFNTLSYFGVSQYLGKWFITKHIWDNPPSHGNETGNWFSCPSMDIARIENGSLTLRISELIRGTQRGGPTQIVNMDDPKVGKMETHHPFFSEIKSYIIGTDYTNYSVIWYCLPEIFNYKRVGKWTLIFFNISYLYLTHLFIL